MGENTDTVWALVYGLGFFVVLGTVVIVYHHGSMLRRKVTQAKRRRMARGAQDHLQGIEGPTRVAVWVTVVSDNTIKSPITGFDAALVRWVILSASYVGDNEVSMPGVKYTAGARRCMGERLIVECENERIRVPVEHVEIQVLEDDEDAISLAGREVPPMLSEASHCRETCIRKDDRMYLVATVDRTSTSAPYRSADQATLEVRPAPEGNALQDEFTADRMTF